jgi:glycosyltransferase involved in cell wall biosynthesis
VLVLPSPKEGLSQVLVQASAADVPFVAYQVDGVDELRSRGARSRVVPIGDESSFATALADELRAADVALGAAGASADDRGPRDVEAWSEWDPVVVAAQYRAHYERDLGRVAARQVSGRRGR